MFFSRASLLYALERLLRFAFACVNLIPFVLRAASIEK